MLYDKDIRVPLFDYFEETYGKTRVFEEKRTGRARADIMLITERHLIGVEIKSDADSYARLSRQVREYDAFYMRNIVVIGVSHRLHIGEHVPEYWGIVTVGEADGKPVFETVREPRDNPKVKWKNTLGFLWRPELARLQELNGLPKYREKSKPFVVGKVASCIPDKIAADVVGAQICDLLFERDYTLIDAEIRDYKALTARKSPAKKVRKVRAPKPRKVRAPKPRKARTAKSK